MVDRPTTVNRQPSTMKHIPPKELILRTLREKSVLKQNVYKQTAFVFSQFKEVVRGIAEEYKEKMAKVDQRITIKYKDKGEFEFELTFAGDLLIFHMHTNVFEFDKSHGIWKTSYVREDEMNSFCGVINVYNFLADSFKYKRVKDVGYLIERIFINKELHYFVEGKRQLGFLYNDFVNSIIDKQSITNIVESTILYCLNFDLFTPPFENVKEVSVEEIIEASDGMQITTGKRLGFRFSSEVDNIE